MKKKYVRITETRRSIRESIEKYGDDELKDLGRDPETWEDDENEPELEDELKKKNKKEEEEAEESAIELDLADKKEIIKAENTGKMLPKDTLIGINDHEIQEKVAGIIAAKFMRSGTSRYSLGLDFQDYKQEVWSKLWDMLQDNQKKDIFKNGCKLPIGYVIKSLSNRAVDFTKKATKHKNVGFTAAGLERNYDRGGVYCPEEKMEVSQNAVGKARISQPAETAMIRDLIDFVPEKNKLRTYLIVLLYQTNLLDPEYHKDYINIFQNRVAKRLPQIYTYFMNRMANNIREKLPPYVEKLLERCTKQQKGKISLSQAMDLISQTKVTEDLKAILVMDNNVAHSGNNQFRALKKQVIQYVLEYFGKYDGDASAHMFFMKDTA